MGRVRSLVNPHRPHGLAVDEVSGVEISRDPAPVLRLLSRCPEYAPTPLRDRSDLADELGIGRLWLKDETARMGLGSFKALGAACVIARDAEQEPLEGVTYVAASAGNHGLSLATGARVFGARSVVYVSRSVPESFERRLADAGAEVRRAGDDYEASMAAAEEAAEQNGWRLLSDSSWPGYFTIPRLVMEGYLAIGAEVVDQLDNEKPPDLVLLQAGVGGLAASLAGFVRSTWGETSRIVVVEPESAATLMESVRAGEPRRADGPPSVMGRLDCKEPSYLALEGLSRWADVFVAVSDEEAEEAVGWLAERGVATTPSGAAGVAALLQSSDSLASETRALAVISEGPTEGEE